MDRGWKHPYTYTYSTILGTFLTALDLWTEICHLCSDHRDLFGQKADFQLSQTFRDLCDPLGILK